MKILIKNTTTATLGSAGKVLAGHDILIENDRIKKIAKNIDEKADKTIDGDGKLALPGFINAHMHFYSSFARGLGKAAPSNNFVEVLENLWWRLDKKLSLDDCYYSTAVACVSAIKHGTTTFIDHHASPGAVRGSLNKCADAIKDTGLRANLCYELSDRDGAKVTQEGIDENLDFIKRCADENDDQLKALFGIHAAFTVSDKSLEAAVSGAKEYGAGFHIHTAEDKADQDHSIKEHGMRVVERLDKLGILGPKTICAHCIHIDENEMDLIKKAGTSVVHNPQSNMNNAVGVADVIKMTEKGILVGLGTDAMTTNMLEELRCALWIRHLADKNPSVGFMEILETLTLNNAKIASKYWDCGLGELKEGAKADVILIDYETPTELSENTIGGHLIFGISQSVVDTTIANGKVLMQDKKLTTIDEKEIMAKSLELSTKLWDRF